ncbi:hypothetical protein EBR21_12225, partial [bacterium]|nr:hypothetical protein [bacterium]
MSPFHLLPSVFLASVSGLKIFAITSNAPRPWRDFSSTSKHNTYKSLAFIFDCSSASLHHLQRSFSEVTTGPGLTNIVTAVAGCWAQRRDLLVIAGQVKSTDLLVPPLRQRGI